MLKALSNILSRISAALLVGSILALGALAYPGHADADEPPRFVFRYGPQLISAPEPWLRVTTSTGWAFECRTYAREGGEMAAALDGATGQNLGYSPAYGATFWGMGFPDLRFPGDIPVLVFHVGGSAEMQAPGFPCQSVEGARFPDHWPGATAAGEHGEHLVGQRFDVEASLIYR